MFLGNFTHWLHCVVAPLDPTLGAISTVITGTKFVARLHIPMEKPTVIYHSGKNIDLIRSR
jgi:hypothetical protein